MIEGERYCSHCGKDSAEAANLPRVDPGIAFGLSPETSGKALFSLICGVFFLLFPFAFVAVIYGYVARSEIRRSGGRLTGDGLAITGIVFGYLGVGFLVFLIGMGVYSVRKVQQAQNKIHARSKSPSDTETGAASLPDNSAVSAMRTLNMAEIAYQQAHRETGYTCSLSQLSSAWGLSDELKAGSTAGYVFKVQDCTAGGRSGPITKYHVVAYPEEKTTPPRPAYCSDDSDTIRVAKSGSPEDCLNRGRDLASEANP